MSVSLLLGIIPYMKTTVEILRVDVNDLHIEGNLLIGDLEYEPYHIFIDGYVFRGGDVVIDDENHCYMDVIEDYLFDLAYGNY